MTFCHNCGKENNDETNFCIYCGVKLINKSIKCLNCGKMNEPNSNFCINCGNNLHTPIKKEIKTKNHLLNNTPKKEYIKPTYKKAKISTKKKKEQINAKPSIYDKEDEARNFFFNNELDKAISIYQELIDGSETYNHKVSYWYYEISTCYRFKGDYDKAIEICEDEIKILKKLGKDYTELINRIEEYENDKVKNAIRNLENTGESAYYKTEFDEAEIALKKAVELGSARYQTFKLLSNVYLREKKLDSAANVLKTGIDRIEKDDYEWSETYLHNQQNDGLKDLLENIEYCIMHGEFKIDCLPIDKNTIKPKIQEAKVTLINDKEKGMEMLEEILAEGTYNNTVYYTLYQNYNKSHQYDESIRICEKAIEVLGFYDKDRKEKWTKYLNKSIERKEKNSI